ncbi:sensor histidine kinase [Flaviaesturariibacter aridisoli]|uniref:histidine kinase n=1 Tax=Flaviaesturariibacter aridisoli TaxID=2545761 RepID=A0A4R4DUY2_9BACT|nr:PAS domain-containing sensor histidine kinase [Flaviaesturariibacter aridisoli]TCZ66947.1 PAS domain-containing sensor histidine kinase [Flaviaesturariibacter aridisoli]
MYAHLSQAQHLADPILQLADAMPQLVWIADAAGTVRYFNVRVEEYKGPRRNPDGSWEWAAAIHPDDLAETALKWQHCLVTGHAYEAEHRMCLADGSWAWHLARAVPQRDGLGAISSWMGTSTNIHRQKETEQTLRDSEERFRLLTNSIPQIIWIVDAVGNTEYVNDRWTTYTGQENEDLDREGRIAMIHPDDLPIVLDTWQEALRAGEPAHWQYRLRHKDTGRYRWFLAHVLPLRDPEGVVRHWICSASDIQAHRDIAGELEQQVELRTRELAALAETLRRQASELKRSNDDLQQFAHIASHDLKEPLRKIRTFGSRLSGEYAAALPERGRDYVDKIETSAQRMSDMIDGVLHYSLIDSMDYVLIPVSLEETLQQVSCDLELVIQKKDARLEWAGLPAVAGIPVLVRQLFFNLVHNALKFMPPGVAPRVEVAARRATVAELRAAGLPEGVPCQYITVRDNGIGFDAGHATAIFKTFTRLHSKDTFEGTGLGLALCQKIVQRHGGAISAESSMGKGSVFTVLLQEAGRSL